MAIEAVILIRLSLLSIVISLLSWATAYLRGTRRYNSGAACLLVSYTLLSRSTIINRLLASRRRLPYTIYAPSIPSIELNALVTALLYINSISRSPLT